METDYLLQQLIDISKNQRVFSLPVIVTYTKSFREAVQTRRDKKIFLTDTISKAIHFKEVNSLSST